MPQSTTDDRSLSAESSEVNVSSPLNHGDEQVREAPSEPRTNKKIDNLAVVIRDLSEQVQELRNDVHRIEDRQKEMVETINGDGLSSGLYEKVGNLTRHILKLRKRFDGDEFDPKNPSPKYKQLIERCRETGDVDKHTAADILDVGPRQALRKLKSVGRKCQDLTFTPHNQRGGNQPSVLQVGRGAER